MWYKLPAVFEWFLQTPCIWWNNWMHSCNSSQTYHQLVVWWIYVWWLWTIQGDSELLFETFDNERLASLGSGVLVKDDINLPKSLLNVLFIPKDMFLKHKMADRRKTKNFRAHDMTYTFSSYNLVMKSVPENCTVQFWITLYISDTKLKPNLNISVSKPL